MDDGRRMQHMCCMQPLIVTGDSSVRAAAGVEADLLRIRRR